MLSSFMSLSGLAKFNLVWNAAFFLLEGFLAVTLHSAIGVAFMVLFGVLFLLAVVRAKDELRENAEREELYNRLFGPTGTTKKG